MRQKQTLQPAHRRGVRRVDPAVCAAPRHAPPRRDGGRKKRRLSCPTSRTKDPSAYPLASASPGSPFTPPPASLEPSLSLQLPKSGSLPHVARRASFSFGWAPPGSASYGRRVLHLAIQGAPAGILAASRDAERPLRRCANNRLVLTLRSTHGPARFGLHLTTRCDHAACAAQPQSLDSSRSVRTVLALALPYVVTVRDGQVSARRLRLRHVEERPQYLPCARLSRR